MPHSQNISNKSAFTRFMLGSILTAFGTARLMRNPKSRMAQGMVVLGAMHAAEGATGYCPSKAMMGNKNMMQNTQGSMAGITQMAGNVAQKMTGGTMQQAANAVQNVVPEVGQLMKDFANATGTTSTSKTASAGQGGNTSKSATAQKGSTSTSTQSGSGTKAASSSANKSGTSSKDGVPSDQMMKEVADQVISASSKNTHSPQITH
ncbi:YgaP-like transmembrane domain [Chungangia koreensis]|uniref:YgaP-like transmembrane domain n=1 Tax=Chungangia koreensis TaxID=752657 RepID=A0ABV8X5Z9_9LACT